VWKGIELFWGLVEAVVLAFAIALVQYFRSHLDFAVILVGLVGSLAILIIGSFRRREPQQSNSQNVIPHQTLQIHSALYGTSPADDIEVAEILQGLQSDAITCLIENNLFKRDPHPNVHKRLKVKYSYGNSIVLTVSRPEGSRLVLPEDSWLKGEIQRLTSRVVELEALKVRQRDFEKQGEQPVGVKSAAPMLWVEYKPRVIDPPATESLVFSKEGDKAIRIRQIGPLTWTTKEERPINIHSGLGPLLTQAVECKFTAFDQTVGSHILYDTLSQLMHEMINRFGHAVHPTVEIWYEDFEDNWYSIQYTLFIDPFDKIIWNPGPVKRSPRGGPLMEHGKVN
jgi:hypothetical protein